jgi:hypothetical protein
MKRDADVARVKFALRLIEMNLAGLDGEEWNQFLREVRNFLRGKAPAEEPREVHDVDFLYWKEKEGSPGLLAKEVSRGLLAEVQGIVRYTLTSVAAENWLIDYGRRPSWGAGSTTVPDEVSVSANLNSSTKKVDAFLMKVEIEKGSVVCDLLPGDLRSYLLHSTLKEAFLFGLQRSLGRVDVSYLRRCPAGPECSRLFFAEDSRQEFCSPRCASRERNRRIRAVAEQKVMKRKVEKWQKGKDGDGVPELPLLVPATGPFKRPGKSRRAPAKPREALKLSSLP